MTPAYVREVVLPRRRAREGARVVAAAIALGCVVPSAIGAAHDHYLRHGEGSPLLMTEEHMRALAYDGFAMWRTRHPAETCPRSLDEVEAYLGAGTPHDAWGGEYYWSCGPHVVPRGAPGIWILSPGADGKLGTGDDVPMEAR